MVGLWKLAEVADNDQHVRCEMEHDGIQEPFVMTRILTIFCELKDPPLSNEIKVI
jgi:hypothetical protein